MRSRDLPRLRSTQEKYGGLIDADGTVANYSMNGAVFRAPGSQPERVLIPVAP